MRAITRSILVAGFGFVCAACVGGSQPVTARETPACESDPRFREFDFWIGDWEVATADGQIAGTNRIEKRERGCMLFESWTGSGGGTGSSINYFDPAKEKWVQVWVAAAGYSIWIEGGLDAGAMRLVGRIVGLDGSSGPFRGTWTPLADGRVRQFFEQSTDGVEWTPWFDGYYSPRARVGD